MGLSEFLLPYVTATGNVHIFPFRNNDKLLLDTASYYFYTIINLIDRIHPITTVYDGRIQQAIEYIHSHYRDPITIQNLADMTYLEPNHFSKLFKKFVKISPHSYIRRYRLNVAASMLLSGQRINEVAEYCGYQSSAAFSSAFRKEFGYPHSDTAKS